MMQKAYTPADFRPLAQQRLPRAFFDYIDGGAYGEHTMNANRHAFDRVQLNQRVLRDVSDVSLEHTFLNQTHALPIGLGPVGLAGLFARRGEAQAHSACANKGVPFCLSTVGICSVDELSAHNSAPFWFQLYVIKDRAVARTLLDNAWQAGCRTLVFTVDLAVTGERYRDARNGLQGGGSLASSLKRGWDLASHPRWLWDVALKGRPLTFGNLSGALPLHDQTMTRFKRWVDEQFDPSVTWDDLGWLRDYWQGQLVIKGILHPDDARQAVRLGADGVVVSNHGGRQLDGAAATLDLLPEIKHAVGESCAVLLDGGVRTGLDVIKALALGADACLLGRAWAYALASNGQAGVEHLLSLFAREMTTAMALMGVTRVSDLGAEHVRLVDRDPS